MHRYLRLPKTSAPFFSFTLPTNCPSSLKKLPSSNLHGCCGCFVRRVTRFPSEARLLVLYWTQSKFAVNPPKTAPALCPERTRACRTCWSSLGTWTGVRTSHGANDLCRKKAHVERFQDFRISHSRVIEVFFITKGIFRDSEAQLKVNSHFQGKENLWWEYDKKKEYWDTVTLLSVVSQFTSLSCKETFLPVVTSASTAVQKGLAFRNLAEAKTTFYTQAYK